MADPCLIKIELPPEFYPGTLLNQLQTMGLRTCPRCETWKPRISFEMRAPPWEAGAIPRYAKHCGSCRREMAAAADAAADLLDAGTAR